MFPSTSIYFNRIYKVRDMHNKYVRVITAYEGPHQEYTEFFRRELTPIFEKIFELAEGAPDVNDVNAFWEYSKNHNVRALGKATDGSTDISGNPAGWLFSAYDHKDVRTIQDALEAADQR